MDNNAYLAFSNFNKTGFNKQSPTFYSLLTIPCKGIISDEDIKCAEQYLSSFSTNNFNFFPKLLQKCFSLPNFNESLKMCSDYSLQGTQLTSTEFKWNWLQIEQDKIAISAKPVLMDYDKFVEMLVSANFFDLILLRNLQRLIELRTIIAAGIKSNSKVSHITNECLDAASLISDSVQRSHSVFEKFARAFYEGAGDSKKFGSWIKSSSDTFSSGSKLESAYQSVKQSTAEAFGNSANEERHRTSNIAGFLHDQRMICNSIDEIVDTYKLVQLFVVLAFAILAEKIAA